MSKVNNMTIEPHIILQGAVKSYEDKYLLDFKPKRTFYEHVQINRIRFWQLLDGTKVPDINEARRLSNYFGISFF